MDNTEVSRGAMATLVLVGILAMLYSCTGNEIANSHAIPDEKQADLEVMRMLSAELERQLEALPARTASTPPMGGKSQILLSLSSGTQLDWGYYSQGDYDQNGEVSAADLTPLAIHFKESVAPGTFAPDSIQAMIDGDGNGEINLADVTPIAINFQNTVTAFNVYRSLDEADYPGGDAAGDNGQAEVISQIPFADAIGNPAETRLAFSISTLEQREGDWLWLRPVDAGIEGIASNIVGPVEAPGFVIRGRITDPHEAIPDMQGVVVNLIGPGLSALTDSEGNYEFVDVPSGDYQIAPLSYELYFEPVQIETTVEADDVDLADVSAYNITTAHTYGFDKQRFVFGLDVDSSGEVVLSGGLTNYDAGGDVPIIKYSQAHKLAWAQTWDSGFVDTYPSVASSSDGSFLMACSSELTLLDEQHWFYSIVKFDSSGNILWQRKWGSLDWDVSFGHSYVEAASNGDYYLFGSTYNGENYSDHNSFLMKLSSNGLVRWQQTLTLPGTNNGGIHEGVEGPEGNLYILGSNELEELNSNVSWFAKVDAGGNLVWSKRWNIPGDSSIGLAVLSSGNLMAAGRTIVNAIDTNAAMLIELTSAGEIVSARKWEIGQSNWLTGCVETPKGGLVCVGRVDQADESRPLLFYLNPEGELDWSMVWISEQGTGLTNIFLDNDNNVVLSGGGKNNQGHWKSITGQLEDIPGMLEDITLETEIPEGSMTNGFGTVSPLEGVEDVGSGNTDMLVIWHHIEE